MIITFDDGFLECVAQVTPILSRYGFGATFYLVAGLMGQASRWLQDELGLTMPLIDWATARELAAAGHYCGAHTMTHPRLTFVHPTTCRAELEDSRRLLEAELRQPIRHLAYPYGDYNASVSAIAAEVGYISACTTQRMCATAKEHPLALPRVSIYGHDSLLDFICRVQTAQSARELLRQRMQQARLGMPRL